MTQCQDQPAKTLLSFQLRSYPYPTGEGTCQYMAEYVLGQEKFNTGCELDIHHLREVL